MFLSGEELTMTPHTFLQASLLASRVASGPAGDTDRETSQWTQDHLGTCCASPGSPSLQAQK